MAGLSKAFDGDRASSSSTASSVSQVLKRYANAYLQKYRTRTTAEQKKVLRAVAACRETTLGTIRYRCVSCGSEKNVPRSCCNRHCPACQWQTQQKWLARQQRLLLPCSYFLITFTLPKQLRPVAMKFPADVYRALMKAAAESLKTAATNPRFVGAVETGFLGVMHTWGRDLSFHPHGHFLVPGGAIDAQGKWKSSRASLFVPEQVLEKLFRGQFKALLDKAGLLKHVDPKVWQGRFVVDSKAVQSGRQALAYLAPYVTRGCVANWRVTRCNDAQSLDDATLVLQVKRSGTRKYKPMPMSVTEFIRRWLQHVAPNGFHRVRHYGFMNSSSRRSHQELQLLIAASRGDLHYLAAPQPVVQSEPAKMQCACCGGMMVSLGYTPPTELPQLAGRAPP